MHHSSFIWKVAHCMYDKWIATALVYTTLPLARQIAAEQFNALSLLPFCLAVCVSVCLPLPAQREKWGCVASQWADKSPCLGWLLGCLCVCVSPLALCLCIYSAIPSLRPQRLISALGSHRLRGRILYLIAYVNSRRRLLEEDQFSPETKSKVGRDNNKSFIRPYQARVNQNEWISS